MLPHLRQFFITRDGMIADMIGGRNYYYGNGGRNFAATIQKTLEDLLFEELDKYDTQIPLVITGGCALNVLFNQKLAEYLHLDPSMVRTMLEPLLAIDLIQEINGLYELASPNELKSIQIPKMTSIEYYSMKLKTDSSQPNQSSSDQQSTL